MSVAEVQAVPANAAPERVLIFDTTLRDGEQTPGVHLNAPEKLEIARQLARLGVDVIEAGFPAASPADFAAVQAVARAISGATVAALARALPQDIQRAWEAIGQARQPRLHVFLATSPVHMQYKLRKSPPEVLEMAESAVRLARSLCSEVEFSAEDATRSDWEFLAEVCRRVVRAGATVVNIPDTVGYSTPEEMRRLFRFLGQAVPELREYGAILSVHCHDDLGMAVANSLAAVEGGARQVECTLNGLGERAGNAALEEIVMALHTRRDYFAAQARVAPPRLATEQLYPSSQLVQSLTGVFVPPNKAIVGANAFAHESGIHQDGVLKERSTYEIMTPASVGVPESRLVLGKLSGRHAFRERLRQLGHELDGEQLSRAFQRFQELADRKGELSDADLVAIATGEAGPVPERYVLRYLHVVSGTGTVPTATVVLSVDGEERQDSAVGDGPVNAAFRAVQRLVGQRAELAGYSLRAVTGGADAVGEVTVRVRNDGRQYLGRGRSTDVIEASVQAYLHALNKMAEDAKTAGDFGNEQPVPKTGDEQPACVP
ncbi:MAG: 2-isopropylmalate synthase [Firmicutes bacterium]|nr:2-isopropylmalate synthase [Bacillota bacterium]